MNGCKDIHVIIVGKERSKIENHSPLEEVLASDSKKRQQSKWRNAEELPLWKDIPQEYDQNIPSTVGAYPARRYLIVFIFKAKDEK